MRRLLVRLAVVSLVPMLVFVGMVVDLSLNGPYVIKKVERFPGANTVAIIASGIAQLGLLVLLGATLLGLVVARQHRQWGWFLLILMLFPLAVVSLFSAGFHPDVGVALMTLLSPLTLLVYSLQVVPLPPEAPDSSGGAL